MSGTLDAVRGSYMLTGRRFQVRSGTVEFVGTTGFDPSLNIVAVYRVATAQGDPLNIQATVSGTLQSPRVALTSDAQPAISESDLVSYLVFGRATDQLTAGERAASGATAARSSGFAGFGRLAYGVLTPSLLGYAAHGLEGFAQNLGLDYVAITSAEVAQAPLSGNFVSSLFAGSQVELGRYLNDNLFLAFSQRLMSPSAGGSRSPGVRLEWRFQPTYTAELFAEDRFARTPSFGLLNAAEAKKVYGFFLFREWGY
jgi:autotransporter translocation and assembly factor TamB